MRFRVNEDSTKVSVSTESTKVSMDMNKQPTFSMVSGDYISGRPDKHNSSHKTVATESSRSGVINRKSFVRQMSFVQVNHREREDTCSPGRNGTSLRLSLIVSFYS
jgi:hypothetical protein